MSYIAKFPRPFLDDIAGSNCVPFVGAGFSLNADLPSPLKMPLWEELGRSFAKLVPDYSFTNAVDAISAFAHEFARPKMTMIEQLSSCLHIGTVKPGLAHKAFCQLPFKTVCTTNFDFLLEDGYSFADRYCRPIIGDTAPAHYQRSRRPYGNRRQGVFNISTTK
jgi:hypothetical protein